MDPLGVLFTFEGRLNRKPFWWYQIGVGIATSIPFLFGEGWLSGVLELWAQAALSVKRAHDRGRSWKFVLLLLVPGLNLWPLAELWLMRGSPGDNAYGPDPLRGAAPPERQVAESTPPG